MFNVLFGFSKFKGNVLLGHNKIKKRPLSIFDENSPFKGILDIKQKAFIILLGFCRFPFCHSESE
jgi:hypothetical protein